MSNKSRSIALVLAVAASSMLVACKRGASVAVTVQYSDSAQKVSPPDLATKEKKSYSMGGCVYNKYNKPVAGVRVVLLSSGSHQSFETTTDSSGMFRFEVEGELNNELETLRVYSGENYREARAYRGSTTLALETPK
jgi:phosphatidate phosphatase APP1